MCSGSHMGVGIKSYHYQWGRGEDEMDGFYSQWHMYVKG